MRTYWDLEERERAALSREDVEKFIDAELMTKGVLKVVEPTYEEEIEAPLETTTFYKLGSLSEVCFRTLDETEAFRKLRPLREQLHWIPGVNIHVVEQLAASTDVVTHLAVEEATFQAYRKDLERHGSIKTANAKKREEYGKAVKEQDLVLSGLWEDWLECGARLLQARMVMAVYAKYLTTAEGDAQVAMRFLLRVYARAAISEAADWTGSHVPIMYDESMEAEASE